MGVHVIVGAGPVGTAVARQLLGRDEHVRVVTRSGSGIEGTERVRADASDAARLTELSEGATAATFRRNLPSAPAVAYLVAWAAGLSVFSSSTQVRASGQHVLASLRGHQLSATAQYVRTEGVTTVLLVLTVWPLRRLCAGRRRRALLVATTAGSAVVSFAELGLGVRLAAADVGPTSAGTLNETIERLDGVKMLLLAAMLGVAARACGAGRSVPRAGSARRRRSPDSRLRSPESATSPLTPPRDGCVALPPGPDRHRHRRGHRGAHASGSTMTVPGGVLL